MNAVGTDFRFNLGGELEKAKEVHRGLFITGGDPAIRAIMFDRSRRTSDKENEASSRSSLGLARQFNPKRTCKAEASCRTGGPFREMRRMGQRTDTGHAVNASQKLTPLHGRSYSHALDSIAKTLRALAHSGHAPRLATEAWNDFSLLFPTLGPVRECSNVHTMPLNAVSRHLLGLEV